MSDWLSISLIAVLLLANASCSPRLNPSEELTLSVHPPSTSRLVLIHDTRSAAVSGTSAWLDERPYVDQHHHVALDDASDFQRLVRFISGKALQATLGSLAKTAQNSAGSNGIPNFTIFPARTLHLREKTLPRPMFWIRTQKVRL